MKNGLAPTTNSCASCRVQFYPRRDNPSAKYCSRACHMRVGVRFKGDQTTNYATLHKRVRKAFGPAVDYPCFRQCCRPARHWACVGDYANVLDYIPMCVSCHKRMDMGLL